MQELKGEHIHLRAIESEDIDFLFNTENDTFFWEVSSTQTPFSRYVLKQFLNNSHLDIYEAKQLRLIIAKNSTDQPIGMIDLFDFNPQHHRAGIGIIVVKPAQKKGYASEALALLIPYCFSTLQLHQLFANVTSDNEGSLALFKKQKFTIAGTKKEWIYSDGAFKDEILLQRIKS